MMSRELEKGKYTTPDGSQTWEYIVTASCSLMSFIIGLSTGWSAPTLAKLSDPDSPLAVGNEEASIIATVSMVGLSSAPLLVITLVDKIGRKRCMLFAAGPMTVSWAMITVATHVITLYISRLLNGIGMGMIMSTMSMYLGEVLSPNIRGTMAMVVTIMFNTGILVITTIVPYLSIQLVATFCLALSIAFLIIFWFVPESPYFLIMAKKIDDAESALEKLRGKTDVSEELDMIKTSVSKTEATQGENQSGQNIFKLLVSVPGNRKAMFIVLLLNLIPNLCAFGTFMGYGHVVFGDMSPEINVNVCLMIFALIQLVTCIVTSFIIEKFGRKQFIAVSGIITVTCLLVIAGYFYLLEYQKLNVTPYSLVPVVSAYVLTIAFSFGLIPTAFIISSEIFSTDIKAVAQCAGMIFNGLAAALTSKYYLMVAKDWGYGHSVPFLFFAVGMFVTVLFLLWVLPETRGKTLMQIQNELNA